MKSARTALLAICLCLPLIAEAEGGGGKAALLRLLNNAGKTGNEQAVNWIGTVLVIVMLVYVIIRAYEYFKDRALDKQYEKQRQLARASLTEEELERRANVQIGLPQTPTPAPMPRT